MPEYLTPGVYVEETSFRSRSIEGVATTTFGMAGLTRYGPVPYVVTPPGRRRWRWCRARAGHQLHRVRAGLRRPRRRRRRTPTAQLPGATPPARSSPTAAGGSTSRGSSRSPGPPTAPIDARPRNFAALAGRQPGRGHLAGPLAGRGRRSEISVAVGFRAQQERPGRRGQRLRPAAGVAPGAAVELFADAGRRPQRTPTPTGAGATSGSSPRRRPTVARLPQRSRTASTRSRRRPAWRGLPPHPRASPCDGATRLDVYTGLELDRAHPRVDRARCCRPWTRPTSFAWSGSTSRAAAGDRRPGRAADRRC